jgi:hypothetical protein
VRKPVKYSGPLAEPIYEIDAPSDTSLGQAARDRAFSKQIDKLFLLAQHFRIDLRASNGWIMLAYRIGSAHVPGMQVVYGTPPRRGRRRTWKAGLGVELVEAVQASRRGNEPLRNTISTLRKAYPKTWGIFTQQNLEARHRDERRSQRKRMTIVKALMDAQEKGEPPSLLELGRIYGIANNTSDG